MLQLLARFALSVLIGSALITALLMLPDSWDRPLAETLKYSDFFAFVGLYVIVTVTIGLGMTLVLHSAWRQSFSRLRYSVATFLSVAAALGWLLASLMSGSFWQAWPGAVMGLVSGIVFVFVCPAWCRPAVNSSHDAS